MTLQANDWWPSGFADRPAVKTVIDAATAAWSAAWLVHARLHVVRVETVPGDVWSGFGADGRRFGKVLKATAQPRALNRVLERLLDGDLASASTSEADRRVLDVLAERAIEDLLSRVEAGFGGAAAGAPPRRGASAARTAGAGQGGLHVGLGEADGGALIWLALPMSVLAAVCRASLPPPRPAAAAPSSRLEAIAREPVAVEAVLGAVHLTLADLASLSCGDVLILDRALTAPADLATAQTATPVGRGQLTEVDGYVALQLQPATPL